MAAFGGLSRSSANAPMFSPRATPCKRVISPIGDQSCKRRICPGHTAPGIDHRRDDNRPVQALGSLRLFLENGTNCSLKAQLKWTEVVLIKNTHTDSNSGPDCRYSALRPQESSCWTSAYCRNYFHPGTRKAYGTIRVADAVKCGALDLRLYYLSTGFTAGLGDVTPQSAARRRYLCAT